VRLEQPQLSFREDGDDVVVSLDVTANNSPHVVWTHFIVNSASVVPPGGRVADARPQTVVALQYCVIQNRNLFVRSQKVVEVLWRIPRGKGGGERFEVGVGFTPTHEEWEALIPKLDALYKP
jgi:hypothetical protein